MKCLIFQLDRLTTQYTDLAVGGMGDPDVLNMYMQASQSGATFSLS